MSRVFNNPCEKVKENLPDYLRDVLSGAEKGEVEHHLAECASCRIELREVRDAFGFLASENYGAVPESYWRNFLPRLYERLNEERTPRISPWLEKYLIPSLGLLAVVFIIARIQIVPPSRETSSDTRKILTEMNTEELQRVMESPTILPVPPFVEPGIAGLAEENVSNGEPAGELLRSTLGLSLNEVQKFSEGSLLGSTESGFEMLTEEEAEIVLRSLQTAGSI